jgi:hypothetical protein
MLIQNLTDAKLETGDSVATIEHILLCQSYDVGERAINGDDAQARANHPDKTGSGL